MPAKSDLRRPRRAVRRGADAAARRAGVDRQRRQSGGAGRALVRSGARPQRFSRRQRRAQPRAGHPAQRRIVSRRERPQPRPRRPHGRGRPETAADGSATWRRKPRCSPRPSAAAPHAAEGAERRSRHRLAAASGGRRRQALHRGAGGGRRGARFRHRQSDYAVRPAQGDHLRPRDGDTASIFIGPLRETVAALLPPSLADVSEIVVREWSDGIWVRGAAAMTLRDLYGAPGARPARRARARRRRREEA